MSFFYVSMECLPGMYMLIQKDNILDGKTLGNSVTDGAKSTLGDANTVKYLHRSRDIDSPS